LVGQKHFGTLGEQHVAAWNNSLGTFPELLACTHSCPLAANQVVVVPRNVWLLVSQVDYFTFGKFSRGWPP
jgi:hypothetical protein